MKSGWRVQAVVLHLDFEGLVLTWLHWVSQQDVSLFETKKREKLYLLDFKINKTIYSTYEIYFCFSVKIPSALVCLQDLEQHESSYPQVLQVRKIYFTLGYPSSIPQCRYVRIQGWRANKYRTVLNGCVYIFVPFWDLYWSYTPTGFCKQIKAFYCSETTSIPQAIQYFLSQ